MASIEMPREAINIPIEVFRPGQDGQCWAAYTESSECYVTVGTKPRGPKWELGEVRIAFEAMRVQVITTKYFNLGGCPAVDLFGLSSSATRPMVRARFTLVKGQMIGMFFICALDPFQRGERFINSFKIKP